ncbi:MAG: hypothetical protein H6577_24465 [Lewinellaceae bacterium]|nr:hypothetical protein [Saprospiraceae bacterium]MCB9341289.1 hypothetical protein [Lewinellaceae bacterium]
MKRLNFFSFQNALKKADGAFQKKKDGDGLTTQPLFSFLACTKRRFKYWLLYSALTGFPGFRENLMAQRIHLLQGGR